MPDTDDAALWFALHHFTTSYWNEVDFNGGSKAHEFYLPGALFAVGDNRFDLGAGENSSVYAQRRKRGVITSRHLINNLQVQSTDAQQARLGGVLSLFYAQGHPPHHGTHPPTLVADIAADCMLGQDKRWRYRSHVLSPLFLGNTLPISVSIDTGRL